MRAGDLYSFRCIRCGKECTSAAKEGTCACGLKWRLEWPGEGKATPHITITEKYERA